MSLGNGDIVRDRDAGRQKDLTGVGAAVIHWDRNCPGSERIRGGVRLDALGTDSEPTTEGAWRMKMDRVDGGAGNGIGDIGHERDFAAERSIVQGRVDVVV